MVVTVGGAPLPNRAEQCCHRSRRWGAVEQQGAGRGSRCLRYFNCAQPTIHCYRESKDSTAATGQGASSVGGQMALNIEQREGVGVWRTGDRRTFVPIALLI